jgi:DNA-binding MarR family transcriptional regulator
MAGKRSGRGRPAGRISTEIWQTRPFGSLEREATVTLLRTGDVLHHTVESALRPWGLSPEQYNVLRILRGADERGLPCLEIAERMLARSPNITRLIDKMVAKGLAERHAMETDRRVVRISATPRARALLAELDPAVEAVLAKLASIAPERLRTLVSVLDAIRERLAVPTAREGLLGGKKKERESRHG